METTSVYYSACALFAFSILQPLERQFQNILHKRNIWIELYKAVIIRSRFCLLRVFFLLALHLNSDFDFHAFHSATKIPKLLYLILHKNTCNERVYHSFVWLFYSSVYISIWKNYYRFFQEFSDLFLHKLSFASTVRLNFVHFGGIIPRRMSHSDEKCAHKQLHWNKMLARVLRLMTVDIAKTHTKKMNYRLKLVMVDVNSKCWHTILWSLSLL